MVGKLELDKCKLSINGELLSPGLPGAFCLEAFPDRLCVILTVLPEESLEALTETWLSSEVVNEDVPLKLEASVVEVEGDKFPGLLSP